MQCPVCNTEMEQGYLFSTKDGAFSFAHDVPSSFKNAKSEPGFTEIASPKVGGRTSVAAELCRTCRRLVVEY